MFTGIVQALGILIGSSDTPTGKRLTVSLAELAHAPIQHGDSVCVSGVCLTATRIANGHAAFDVITETLRHTTLGQKHIADRVNLELSLQPHSYLGGHFVQGHIDTMGKIVALQQKTADWRITTEIPPQFMPYMVPKGSVAIDGVSMTIAEVSPTTFTIAVIPTTLEHTTLSALKLGEQVNIESDILARTTIHYLRNFIGTSPPSSPSSSPADASTPASTMTLGKLIERGFA